VAGSAARALGKIGPAAADAVPRLIEKLTDPNLRHDIVAWSLGRIGPAAEAARPALMELLTDGKDIERADAALAIGRISRTPEAVQALRDALANDADLEVRLHAAVALAEMNSEAADESVVAALEGAAGDDGVPGALVGYGLARLGRIDEGLRILTDLVLSGDGQSDPEGTAADLLGELGAMAHPAQSALLEAARRPDLRLSEHARGALNRIRAAADT